MADCNAKQEYNDVLHDALGNCTVAAGRSTQAASAVYPVSVDIYI